MRYFKRKFEDGCQIGRGHRSNTTRFYCDADIYVDEPSRLNYSATISEINSSTEELV